MGRVQGRVVIVTGGASGVGKEDCLLLALEGARVVITDVNEEGGRAVAKAIGESALFLRHDISVEDDWKTVMGATQDRFGRLDGLVNNAGILLLASIEDTTLEQWRNIQRVNADGYFLGCKYGVAAMKKTGGGSIVNMSSSAASVGMPMSAAYSGSKGSVAALTRSVAAVCKANGYRIRCNSIHPDGILTPMTIPYFGGVDPKTLTIDANPQTRFAEPRDVANLVLFLVSDESRFINGAELHIDNAMTVTNF
jgi:3(or 17)beta-hydroxysteroid dehydrogenase